MGNKQSADDPLSTKLDQLQSSMEESATLRKQGIRVDVEGGIVIPNHKFRTEHVLCRVETGDEYKMRYLRERYDFLNENLFGGVLRTPNFVITRGSKNLGSWHSDTRTFRMSRSLFKAAHDRELLNTIAHEMAHQYVREYYHSTEADPHGSEWSSVMIAIGLPPNAVFRGDRESVTPVDVLKRRTELQRLLQLSPFAKIVNTFKEPMVARFIDAVKDIDEPVIVLPRFDDTENFVSGFTVRDGRIHEAKFFRISYLAVPGSLKIKTPAYRAVTDLINRTDFSSET
jgi:predicted SprT family Zn-dependent metalloprotease